MLDMTRAMFALRAWIRGGLTRLLGTTERLSRPEVGARSVSGRGLALLPGLAALALR
jgi:hypothetical protein